MIVLSIALLLGQDAQGQNKQLPAKQAPTSNKASTKTAPSAKPNTTPNSTSPATAAQVKQAIPVSVIACQARDLEPEHDADVTQRHFGGHAGEAAAPFGGGAREPEVVIDDRDLLRGPSERVCPFDEGGLA